MWLRVFVNRTPIVIILLLFCGLLVLTIALNIKIEHKRNNRSVFIFECELIVNLL